MQEKPADACRLAVVVRVFQHSVVQDGLSIVHPGVCSLFPMDFMVFGHPKDDALHVFFRCHGAACPTSYSLPG